MDTGQCFSLSYPTHLGSIGGVLGDVLLIVPLSLIMFYVTPHLRAY